MGDVKSDDSKYSVSHALYLKLYNFEVNAPTGQSSIILLLYQN